jgi:hypothetical protein
MVVCRALVSQLAEETDSKPVQCEFESHRGHQTGTGVTAGRRVFRVEHHCEMACRGHILATLSATDDRSESNKSVDTSSAALLPHPSADHRRQATALETGNAPTLRPVGPAGPRSGRRSAAAPAGSGAVNTSDHQIFTSDSVAVRCTWHVGHNVVRPNRIGTFAIAGGGSYQAGGRRRAVNRQIASEFLAERALRGDGSGGTRRAVRLLRHAGYVSRHLKDVLAS